MLVFDSITSFTSPDGPESTDQGPHLPRATEPAEAKQRFTSSLKLELHRLTGSLYSSSNLVHQASCFFSGDFPCLRRSFFMPALFEGEYGKLSAPC